MSSNNGVSVGIWGLGSFLPETVRPNSWWPKEIVEEWRVRQGRRFTNLEGRASELSPGAKLVMEASERYANDPFEGSTERRIIADDMTGTDMGIRAAKDAMARAGVTAKDIDLLLVQSMVPDHLNTPDGCRIQEQLGIPTRCFTTTVEASCSGFLSQMVVAQGLINADVGKVALMVQISPMSRILRPRDPWSAAFGDAATAVVVGAVRPGRGILAQAHATNGATYGGLVTGVPDGRWHEQGAAYMYVKDNDKARTMVMSIPDFVKDLTEDTLAKAGVEKSEVRYIASHQATDWFGRVMRQYLEMPEAKLVNTYPWTTSLSGANLPFVMGIAEREHLVKDDDVVVMFSGATGMTAGSIVYRWGR